MANSNLSNNKDFKKCVRLFLEEGLSAKSYLKEKEFDLQRPIYRPRGAYHDSHGHLLDNKLEYKACFGQATIAHCPYLAVFGYEQTIKKGIYPCLLFNLDIDEHNLEIAYGVSQNNPPQNSWAEMTVEGKDHSQTKNYSASLLESSYTINNEKDIEDNLDEILKDLERVTNIYLEEFSVQKANPISQSKNLDSYSKEDFLNEVFIEKTDFENLVGILKHKKNLILQGAPGVGKTFIAERLAYAMMGKKDRQHIEKVQFHQNYSYEDFVMGYKPQENGFTLEKGIFHKFCTEAQNNPEEDYFFIIDEINRGNMSKIFGELLMLIEKDYRGSKNALTLPYDKNQFYVPENLYIIGMMNTADRSLAMIDYALRRRFSFFTIEPGFTSKGFQKLKSEINQTKFNDVIEAIIDLNREIEQDITLGKGFCIGHSYFCINKDDYSDEWLKRAVNYEIIPMLEEYWFDESDKITTWKSRLQGIVNV